MGTKSAFDRWWESLPETIPIDPQEMARRAFNAGWRDGSKFRPSPPDKSINRGALLDAAKIISRVAKAL